MSYHLHHVFHIALVLCLLWALVSDLLFRKTYMKKNASTSGKSDYGTNTSNSSSHNRYIKKNTSGNINLNETKASGNRKSNETKASANRNWNETKTYPRIAYIAFDYDNFSIHNNNASMDTQGEKNIGAKMVETMSEQIEQGRLRNSKRYQYRQVKKRKSDCRLQQEWQGRNYPLCNPMHEIDLTIPINNHGEPKYIFLATGRVRLVFTLCDDASGLQTVMKLQRFDREFTAKDFDRNRRDALTMGELTRNKYILNIYGFCGTSGVFEFASQDLKAGVLSNSLSGMEKLHIGTLLDDKYIEVQVLHLASLFVVLTNN